MLLTLLASVLGLGGATLGIGAGIGCFALSAPGYNGPKSNHFNGETFQNLKPLPQSGFLDFLKWQWERKQGPWEAKTEERPRPMPATSLAPNEVRVTFVNHATILLQFGDLNILTDPIWSLRASPFEKIGPNRHRPPGIQFSDLPKIHAIVVSHNHYDHMDIATLRRLAERDDPVIYVPLGNKSYLESKGISNSRELDWWEADSPAEGLQITAVPAQHFSSRGLCDRNETLWAGYVIAGRNSAIYFAGDTGFGPHFELIGERFPNLDLALLPIGAFKPEWFMSGVHVSPQEAVRAHRDLKTNYSMAMHFGTFALADDGQDEPVRELRIALEKAGIDDSRFWVLPEGEGRLLELPQN